MKESTKNEIIWHILKEFNQVNARQLFNHVKPFMDGYILKAYGKTLYFNSEGDIIDK